jgi:hypothetical protein
MTLIPGTSSNSFGDDVFSMPLQFSQGDPKQATKADVEISNIVGMVACIRSEMHSGSLFLIGRVLVGLVRMFSLRVDSFELKIQAVMNHIDKVLSYDSAPKERKPRRPANSARRQALRSAITLPTVPETNSIMAISLDDVIFENTTIPSALSPIMSHTPGGSDSGRKRRLSSTPSRRRYPSSPFENIMMTPDGFSLDSDGGEDNTTKRSRRMSSISEVMDSLREDDGSRRLSGLMGSRQPRDSILTTAGNSAVQSPQDLFDAPEPTEWDNEDDDHNAAFLQTPLQPVSLLQLTTGPRPTRIPRKTHAPASIRSLMDRKGKRGIEMDSTALAKRRNQLLDYPKKHPLYITNPTSRIVFPIADFFRDFSSHIRWYVAPSVQPPPRRQNRTAAVNTPDNLFDLSYDLPHEPNDPVEPLDPVEPIILPTPLMNPGEGNSFLDKIARSKKPVLMSSALSRTQIVADFVKSLHYISEGVLEIVKSNEIVSLNSATQTNLARGPRWESFILS